MSESLFAALDALFETWDTSSDVLGPEWNALAERIEAVRLALPDDDPTAGLPADLAALLRDPRIIVPQDQRVFELIASWMKAPSDTPSAPPGERCSECGGWSGFAGHDERCSCGGAA